MDVKQLKKDVKDWKAKYDTDMIKKKENLGYQLSCAWTQALKRKSFDDFD